MDTKELKKHYKGSDWHNAYDDIGRFLDKRGFERSQGSVYDSKKAMKNSAIGEIIDDICDKFKWFAPCVKSIRGYDQPKVVDYTKQATDDKKIFIEPENMVYKNKDKNLFDLENLVSFNGFITRLNNFYSELDGHIKENIEQISRLDKEIVELETVTGNNALEYKRKDYLEALREDNRLIIDEIEKSAKDKNYKSEFEPKSAKILQALNAKSFKNEEILR